MARFGESQRQQLPSDLETPVKIPPRRFGGSSKFQEQFIQERERRSGLRQSPSYTNVQSEITKTQSKIQELNKAEKDLQTGIADYRRRGLTEESNNLSEMLRATREARTKLTESLTSLQAIKSNVGSLLLQGQSEQATQLSEQAQDISIYNQVDNYISSRERSYRNVEVGRRISSRRQEKIKAIEQQFGKPISQLTTEEVKSLSPQTRQQVGLKIISRPDPYSVFIGGQGYSVAPEHREEFIKDMTSIEQGSRVSVPSADLPFENLTTDQMVDSILFGSTQKSFLPLTKQEIQQQEAIFGTGVSIEERGSWDLLLEKYNKAQTKVSSYIPTYEDWEKQLTSKVSTGKYAEEWREYYEPKHKEFYEELSYGEKWVKAGYTEIQEKPLNFAVSTVAWMGVGGALGLVGRGGKWVRRVSYGKLIEKSPIATQVEEEALKLSGDVLKFGLPTGYLASVGIRTEGFTNPETLGKITVGETIPMFLGGYGGAKLYPKIEGWWRTRGRTEVKIPTFEGTFPSTKGSMSPSETAKLHKKLFEEPKYDIQKVLREPTGKAGGFHATPEAWAKEISKVDKDVLHIANIPSTHFLGIEGTKTSLYGGKLFEPYGKPSLMYIEPKKFEINIGTEFKRGSYSFKKPTETGVAYVVGTKKEIQAVLIPETELFLTGKKYYGKVGGVRVPIDTFKTSDATIKNILGTGGTKFGDVAYSYTIPKSYPITTPSSYAVANVKTLLSSYKPPKKSYVSPKYSSFASSINNLSSSVNKYVQSSSKTSLPKGVVSYLPKSSYRGRSYKSSMRSFLSSGYFSRAKKTPSSIPFFILGLKGRPRKKKRKRMFRDDIALVQSFTARELKLPPLKIPKSKLPLYTKKFQTAEIRRTPVVIPSLKNRNGGEK